MSIFDWVYPPDTSSKGRGGSGLTKKDRAMLVNIERRIIEMSQQLDRLTASVSNEDNAVDSALALINGLAQQIRDLASQGSDAAAMNDAATKLADDIDAKAQALADAVSANSPTNTGGGSTGGGTGTGTSTAPSA